MSRVCLQLVIVVFPDHTHYVWLCCSINIGFLSNTGLDLLKIHKATKLHSLLGHHWHVSETPFQW